MAWNWNQEPRWRGGYASGDAALNIQVPRGPAPGNMRLSPSERAERGEMDFELVVTSDSRNKLHLLPEECGLQVVPGQDDQADSERAVEQLMEDLSVADEADAELAGTAHTASILMGAVSAAVRGDLPLMKQLVASLSVDEVSGCYQAVNILLANLLAKDAAGNIKEYK